MKSDVESRFGIWRRPGDALPADLVAAVTATVVADAVVLVGGPPALSFVAAAALLFVLPGYAVVAALYPDGSTGRDDADGRGGVTLTERFALSFGASVAAVAVLGLVAWYAGNWLTGPGSTATGITRGTTVLLLTLLVVGGCTAAAVRRLRRPEADRFSMTTGDWIDAGRAAVVGDGTRSERFLNVVLAACVVLAIGTLGYAVASPVEAGGYTSVTLLTEGNDGDLTLVGTPPDLAAGETTEVVLELANHEGTETTYTTVVRLERVNTGGGGVTVTQASELDRLSVSVPAGEARTVPHEVAPEMTGERLRLSYYVYRGDAPANPAASSAYRHVYLWMSVGEG